MGVEYVRERNAHRKSDIEEEIPLPGAALHPDGIAGLIAEDADDVSIAVTCRSDKPQPFERLHLLVPHRTGVVIHLLLIVLHSIGHTEGIVIQCVQRREFHIHIVLNRHRIEYH